MVIYEKHVGIQAEAYQTKLCVECLGPRSRRFIVFYSWAIIIIINRFNRLFLTALIRNTLTLPSEDILAVGKLAYMGHCNSIEYTCILTAKKIIQFIIQHDLVS